MNPIPGIDMAILIEFIDSLLNGFHLIQATSNQNNLSYIKATFDGFLYLIKLLSDMLNGNAFDISYVSFNCRKLKVTSCDKWFMKEALAEIIYELRRDKRCWATYERGQTCFHVV